MHGNTCCDIDHCHGASQNLAIGVVVGPVELLVNFEFHQYFIKQTTIRTNEIFPKIRSLDMFCMIMYSDRQAEMPLFLLF